MHHHHHPSTLRLDFDNCTQGELGGGLGAIFGFAPLGNPFPPKMSARGSLRRSSRGSLARRAGIWVAETSLLRVIFGWQAIQVDSKEPMFESRLFTQSTSRPRRLVERSTAPNRESSKSRCANTRRVSSPRQRGETSGGPELVAPDSPPSPQKGSSLRVLARRS